jgi:hypothetical protein
MQQADIDVRDFALQVRLGPLDRCLAEALADAGAAVVLVDEVVTVNVDRDTGGAGSQP